jgi:homocitrate synthase NifV
MVEPRIIDTTLREGEQTPGVSFSLGQKKRIIDGLVDSGVSEIEIGLASPLSTDSDLLAGYCRSKHPGMSISLWSRCRKEDIDHGARIQPDVLSLSIPVSDLHIEQKMGKDRRWVECILVDSVRRARRKGLAVSFGFEDATRADRNYLLHLARLAEQTGVSRIRLADTVGIGSPLVFQSLVKQLKEVLLNCEIGVHTHNDFGMASANAITALECGAQWADGTILGLGERTGCARLEELVGYLQLNRGVNKFDIASLKVLATEVADFTNRNISATQPLLGDDIFACETGIHLHGIIANPETYEPYAPESVGAGRKLIFGAKIGRRALKYWAEIGVEKISDTGVSDEQLRYFRSRKREHIKAC